VIVRYILHIEAHWGYRPRISLRRAPRSGDRVTDGGVPGTLRRCALCGEGFLHEPDPIAIPTRGGQQRHPTALGPVPMREYWVYPEDR
jgi:hypothetical protein